MLFKSPHANMCFNVRPPLVKYHPTTGVIIGESPALRAEFGQLGDEFTITNPETGELETVANISGHFFDSDVAAQINGWTDDEKESVEALLLMKCRQVPGFIQQVVKEHVPAPKPWATYDELDVESILEVAIATRLLPETLRYERENLQRPDLIEALEDKMLADEDADFSRSEPLEEYAAGALDADAAGPTKPLTVAQPPGRTDGGIVTSL